MNSVNLESLPRLGFFLESRFNSSCAVESWSRGTSQVATEIFLISQDFLEFPLFISQHFLFLYFLIHVMFKKSKFQSFSRFETTLFFFYHLRFFPMEKRNGEGGLRDHPGCEERGRGGSAGMAEELWIHSPKGFGAGGSHYQPPRQDENIQDGEVKPSNHILRE